MESLEVCEKNLVDFMWYDLKIGCLLLLIVQFMYWVYKIIVKSCVCDVYTRTRSTKQICICLYRWLFLICEAWECVDHLPLWFFLAKIMILWWYHDKSYRACNDVRLLTALYFILYWVTLHSIIHLYPIFCTFGIQNLMCCLHCRLHWYELKFG